MQENRRSFSLLELLTAVAIIGLLVTLAVDQYFGYIHEARISKSQGDLEKLAQALRLYNTREEEPYDFKSFIPLIGSYMMEPPPKDPWGSDYILDPDIGIVYSRGPNGVDEKGDPLGDDLSRAFLPTEILLKSVRYQDSNINGRVDIGDTLFLNFTRPIITERGLDSTAFSLNKPEMSLGSAVVEPIDKEQPSRTLIVKLQKPTAPNFDPGTVKLNITGKAFDLIRDLSSPPKKPRQGPWRKIMR